MIELWLLEKVSDGEMFVMGCQIEDGNGWNRFLWFFLITLYGRSSLWIARRNHRRWYSKWNECSKGGCNKWNRFVIESSIGYNGVSSLTCAVTWHESFQMGEIFGKQDAWCSRRWKSCSLWRAGQWQISGRVAGRMTAGRVARQVIRTMRESLSK
jgi:hypothetical protein